MSWEYKPPLREALVPFKLHILLFEHLVVPSMPLFTVSFQQPTLLLLGAFVDLRAYELGYVGYRGPQMEAFACDIAFRILKEGSPFMESVNTDSFGFPWHYSYLSYIKRLTEIHRRSITDHDRQLLTFLAKAGEQSDLVLIADVQKP